MKNIPLAASYSKIHRAYLLLYFFIPVIVTMHLTYAKTILYEPFDYPAGTYRVTNAVPGTWQGNFTITTPSILYDDPELITGGRSLSVEKGNSASLLFPSEICLEKDFFHKDILVIYNSFLIQPGTLSSTPVPLLTCIDENGTNRIIVEINSQAVHWCVPYTANKSEQDDTLNAGNHYCIGTNLYQYDTYYSTPLADVDSPAYFLVMKITHFYNGQIGAQILVNPSLTATTNLFTHDKEKALPYLPFSQFCFHGSNSRVSIDEIRIGTTREALGFLAPLPATPPGNIFFNFACTMARYNKGHTTCHR